MTSPRVGLSRLICGVFALCLATTPVLAQSDGASNTDSSKSFASAFFISTNADGSVEILGSLIIWFLLVLSLLSIGLIGMMILTNQRKSISPERVVEEVRNHLNQGKFKEAMALTGRDESFFCQIMHAALKDAPHGFGALTRSLEQTADELTTIRLRKIEYLNVLGQVSPMIGLFGTVYGMILAFQAIVISGGNADPILLASGIGTALTTTFWGLVVAIPALAGYAIIRNHIDELTMDATLRAEEMLNQFRPKPASAPGAKPSPKPQAKDHDA
ncbi:MAG: MotA/TolQ/ExbB proton channel family protein [Planctomycetota bacterium]|nr:MotA/TolQ/ExbB proton channel family protein [Planctomycetota bacterium]